MSEPMKNLSRLLLAPTLAVVLLLACTPTNAARRISGSPYDGPWSVAIYTLRGGCSSVRVATRIVGGRVYSEDQSYQANGGVGANGVIQVSISGFGRSAAGSGRLSRNSGDGRADALLKAEVSALKVTNRSPSVHLPCRFERPVRQGRWPRRDFRTIGLSSWTPAGV